MFLNHFLRLFENTSKISPFAIYLTTEMAALTPCLLLLHLLFIRFTFFILIIAYKARSWSWQSIFKPVHTGVKNMILATLFPFICCSSSCAWGSVFSAPTGL